MKNLLCCLLFCFLLSPAVLDAQPFTGKFWSLKDRNAWDINGSRVRLIAFSMTTREGQSPPKDKRAWVRESFLRAAELSEERNRNMNFGKSCEFNPTRREIDHYGTRIFVFGFYDYTRKTYAYRAISSMGGDGRTSRGFGAWDENGRAAGRPSDEWSRPSYTIGGNSPGRNPTIKFVYAHHRGNTGKMRIYFEYHGG